MTEQEGTDDPRAEAAGRSTITTWLLESDAAAELCAEVLTLEDLHLVLQCCERLISEVGQPPPRPPGLDAVVETLWRTAVAAYQRCFAGTVPLTEQDVLDVHPEHPEILTWHKALRGLLPRDPGGVERGACTVGVVRADAGAPLGIAVTAPDPVLPDESVVRAAGAIAYALSGLVDGRINVHQAALFEEVSQLSQADLDLLPRLETSSPA